MSLKTVLARGLALCVLIWTHRGMWYSWFAQNDSSRCPLAIENVNGFLHVDTCQELCRNYAWTMQELCRNYGRSMAELWLNYAGTMAELWRNYAGTIQELCRNYAGTMAELCRNYSSWKTQNWLDLTSKMKVPRKIANMISYMIILAEAKQLYNNKTLLQSMKPIRKK